MLSKISVTHEKNFGSGGPNLSGWGAERQSSEWVVRKFEIGRKPISSPKSEILNWTQNARQGQFNLRFRISDLRWAFVRFQNSSRRVNSPQIGSTASPAHP